LNNVIRSILAEIEEDVQKYLNAYKKFSEACSEGLPYSNEVLNREYRTLEILFEELKAKDYFSFNGKKSEEERLNEFKVKED
jgi:hypothetical protein